MKKVLIINAHQKYDGFAEGKLNQTMIDTMASHLTADGHEVKLTGIEQGYDVDEEVGKHVWADVIITQTPVYWFGSPWIYKRYIDEVLTGGLMQQSLLVDDGRTREDSSKQYGSGGKMQDKKFMLSLTWNAPLEAFGDDNQTLFEGKVVDDVVIATTAVYKFCGTEILPSFSCHDVVKNPDVQGDIARVKTHLNAMLN